MSSADSTGDRILLTISSEASSLQLLRSCRLAGVGSVDSQLSAPERPSRVTCQVNASPRTFSDSSSLVERGKEFFHSSNIRGRRLLTTGGPEMIWHILDKERLIMTAPIISQPACVR
ncbi:unnamed protein product, partial [Ixodes hexagonus]